MDDWQEESLDDCLEVLIDYRGKSPQKSAVGIPVLSAKVVKTRGLVRPIEQRIAAEYYPTWMVRGLPAPGDVVMTTEAPLGEVIQLDDQTAKYALGQRVVCMRGKANKLDNTFLRYVLASSTQQAVLARYATGTTVLGISQKSLRSVPIRHPGFEEQRRIGLFLKSLDDKIELNQRMNETLEAMASAMFKDWFVDFGPIRANMEGRSPYLASNIWSMFPNGLDEFGKPDGWTTAPLSEVFEIIGGGTPKTDVGEYWDGDIPWFSVADTPSDGGSFVHDTDKHISIKGLQESSSRLVPPDTTIISARGTVGNIAIAAKEMSFNQSCYALKAKEPYGSWLVYLTARYMVTQLQALAHGSVFSTITRPTFDMISLSVGSPELLKAFENTVNPWFEQQKANGVESRTLSATRDLLLPKLISGEVRVRDAAKLVGDAV